MFNEKRLIEIGEFIDENGKPDAVIKFGLSPETIKRYYTAYQTMKGTIDSRDAIGVTVARLLDRFTPKELKAIADGKSIDPSSGENPKISFEGEEFTALFVTDTHWGAKHSPKQYWEMALEEAYKQGATHIFHGGDMIEGMSNRPDHVYSLTHVGYSAQMDLAEELLSMSELPIYIVSGNHDLWGVKSGGIFAVQDVANRLDHVTFLGDDIGTAEINGTKWMIHHGQDGGGCFDDKTEIQTRNGWKKFCDLSYDDEVATMTKSGHEFQWQKPTDILIKPYSGKMLHFESRTVDCMVTPEHGMWTRASNAVTYRRCETLEYPTKSHIQLNTEWHRKDAGDLLKEYSRQKWQFTKVADKWEGSTPEYVEIPRREPKNNSANIFHYNKLDPYDAAELIAWYVTEGHCGKKGKTTLSQYISVNPENHEQIVDLARRIGGKYSVNEKNITLYSMELSEWLKDQAGHLSRYKYLPEWLKNSDTDLLNLVIDTMVKGDGWVRSTPSNVSYGYRSLSKRLREDFAEIAIKCGYAVTFYKEDQLGISKGQVTPTVNTRPKELDYDGMIYCCEVPNGLIHVRRNGKTLWTHNSYAISYRPQKIVEAFSGGEKPNVLMTGHDHKMGYFQIRNVHCILGGALCKQSSWMRATRKANFDGFWILKAGIANKEIKWMQNTWYPFYNQ